MRNTASEMISFFPYFHKKFHNLHKKFHTRGNY